MITVNSISGGKTSSFIAKNYPADYNIFSLVRTNDKECIYPDKKTRQIVSDKIGVDFIGTLEQDNIITIMLELEQYIGKEITWLTAKPFEDIINGDWNKGKNGSHYLPNMMVRYCTTELKMKPIFEWWQNEINEVCEMRIERMIEKLNDKGNEEIKVIVGKNKTRNKWGMVEWRKPKFPLIEDRIDARFINDYWNKNKEVKFEKGYYNNCVGCFHRQPMFLNKMSNEHSNKMEWFSKQEELNYPNTFKKGQTYKEIISYNSQLELEWEDFNDCDSGYCGL